MNSHNTLLHALDKIYGHQDTNNSTFKPIRRYFNQKTGELITIIEYKTKKQGEITIPKKKPITEKKQQRLLQAILQQ